MKQVIFIILYLWGSSAFSNSDQFANDFNQSTDKIKVAVEVLKLTFPSPQDHAFLDSLALNAKYRRGQEIKFEAPHIFSMTKPDTTIKLAYIDQWINMNGRLHNLERVVTAQQFFDAIKKDLPQLKLKSIKKSPEKNSAKRVWKSITSFFKKNEEENQKDQQKGTILPDYGTALTIMAGVATLATKAPENPEIYQACQEDFEYRYGRKENDSSEPQSVPLIFLHSQLGKCQAFDRQYNSDKQCEDFQKMGDFLLKFKWEKGFVHFNSYMGDKLTTSYKDRIRHCRRGLEKDGLGQLGRKIPFITRSCLSLAHRIQLCDQYHDLKICTDQLQESYGQCNENSNVN